VICDGSHLISMPFEFVTSPLGAKVVLNSTLLFQVELDAAAHQCPTAGHWLILLTA